MSENTEMTTAEGVPADDLDATESTGGQDNLLELPPEKLAAMLREKRKAEASVRSKLRDAEAERDQLAGAVTGFRRQAFAEAAKGSRMHESALDDVLAAVNLEDVLGDDGTVDPAKVGEVLRGLQRSHPHYFEQRPRASGIGAGGAPTVEDPASWSDVLHR